jgi:hypothetical protein
MAQCPYTQAVFYPERKQGKLIEIDPDKTDGVFEVNESLTYHIDYINQKTHTKKPIAGIAVTIYNPKKKSHMIYTNSKGDVTFKPDMVGNWGISYYDKYLKRTIMSIFPVIKPVIDEPVEDNEKPLNIIAEKENKKNSPSIPLPWLERLKNALSLMVTKLRR